MLLDRACLTLANNLNAAHVDPMHRKIAALVGIELRSVASDDGLRLSLATVNEAHPRPIALPGVDGRFDFDADVWRAFVRTHRLDATHPCVVALRRDAWAAAMCGHDWISWDAVLRAVLRGLPERACPRFDVGLVAWNHVLCNVLKPKPYAIRITRDRIWWFDDVWSALFGLTDEATRRAA